jgi:outer membrane lipoprotein SlyB
VLRFSKLGLLALALAAPAACTPDYSPNTYASNAVQQANKVEPAIVIGFRQVEISASGTVGAVSGGAAGGILGAQAGSGGIATALSGVGGALAGSLVGTGIEHATSDTTGWEYIVRKANGELLSVTQREPKPLALGQKVLVITGNQARIVPDYSLPEPAAATAAPEKDKPAATNAAPEKEDRPAASTPTPAEPAAATAKPTPLTPPAPASDAAPQAPPPLPEATTPETTAPETTAPTSPPAATDRGTDESPPPPS